MACAARRGNPASHTFYSGLTGGAYGHASVAPDGPPDTPGLEPPTSNPPQLRHGPVSALAAARTKVQHAMQPRRAWWTRPKAGFNRTQSRWALSERPSASSSDLIIWLVQAPRLAQRSQMKLLVSRRRTAAKLLRLGHWPDRRSTSAQQCPAEGPALQNGRRTHLPFLVCHSWGQAFPKPAQKT